MATVSRSQTLTLGSGDGGGAAGGEGSMEHRGEDEDKDEDEDLQRFKMMGLIMSSANQREQNILDRYTSTNVLISKHGDGHDEEEPLNDYTTG